MSPEIRLPDPLRSLTRACDDCVVDCCGLQAYVFNQQTIGAWIREASIEKAREALAQLEAILAEVAGRMDSIYIPDLDTALSGGEWTAPLQQWRRELILAVAAASA